MNLKKITSLTMLTSVLVMIYTGIMLFIAPPGRIANWADWRFFALSKEQLIALHTTFMVVFIVATILHIIYNWRLMISYLRNSARSLIVFTKEMIIASLITVVTITGTLYEIPPFSTFVSFSADVSDSWIREYGEPPYGHAELSTIQNFSKKVGLDSEQSKKALLDAGIAPDDIAKSLKEIAKANGASPEALYLIMKNAQSNSTATKEEKSLAQNGEKYTGLGRRKIADVAQVVGLSTDELIAKLKTIGIDANAEDRFKDIAESNGLSPSDIIEKLGI